MRRGMLAEVPTHEDQARKWVSTWSEERCIVRHRWISQDGKACLLASWFLSRDVAVHSGVVGASAPAPRCFKFRRKTRLGALEARQLPTRRFGKTLAQPPGDSTSWSREDWREGQLASHVPAVLACCASGTAWPSAGTRLESAVRATGPLGPWRAPVWPGGQYRTSWRTYAALFTPDHSRHDVLYSVWYSVHGSDSLFFAR